MSRIGVFVCHCGHNIAGTVDVAAVAEQVQEHPAVVFATDYEYMCSDPGQQLIRESIAKYNPLRDFLATYRATQLQLAFEQIESIIGSKLETTAHTFKSWWENDRSNPQAIAWMEAGWEVVDVILEQRMVIFRRIEQP